MRRTVYLDSTISMYKRDLGRFPRGGYSTFANCMGAAAMRLSWYQRRMARSRGLSEKVEVMEGRVGWDGRSWAFVRTRQLTRIELKRYTLFTKSQRHALQKCSDAEGTSTYFPLVCVARSSCFFSSRVEELRRQLYLISLCR